MQDKLRKMQDEVDELFAKDGLTNEVLEKQLEINRLRHEHDISDEKNSVHQNFVQ